VPRHSCPGNPDCFVDCPDGGTAVFHEPYGPCERRCDEAGFGSSILELDNLTILELRVSGIIEDYPIVHIGSFVRELGNRKLPVGASEIRELVRLSADRQGKRISAAWYNADLRELLQVLVSASASESGGVLPA
jgi:hypothetical protein